MTHPFEPIGEKARWRLLYEVMAAAEVDSVVSYADLADALDLDAIGGRQIIQQAMSRAGRELLEKNNRAVESVRGVGYRVVRPEEQLRLAQYHQQRASKSLVRGSRTVRHVDFNGMDAGTRHAFEVTGRALGALIDMNRRLDARQERLEESMKSVVGRVDRSDDEIAALRERLARLESRA